MAFSPSEDRVAYIGRNVRVLSIESRKTLFSVHPFSHPSTIDFSPDGVRLAVKSTSGHVVILDAESGQLLKDFRNKREGEGSSALFSRCGQYVITVSWDGLLSIRDAATAEPVFVYNHDACMLNDLSAPADRRFFVYSIGRRPPSDFEPPPPEIVVLRPWPIRESAYQELPRRWSFICAMQVSPSGRYVGVVHGAPPETFEVYDLEAFRTVSQCEVEFGGTGCSLSWSSDEMLIATNGKQKCRVLEMPSLSCRHDIRMEYPCFVGFSPSSRFLALGSWSESFIVPVDSLVSFEKRMRGDG